MSVIDDFKTTTIKLYGERKTKDNKCIFCGTDLSQIGYCSCRQSTQLNIVYRKVNTKLTEILEFGEDVDFKNKKLAAASVPAKFKGLEFSAFKTSNTEQQRILKSVIDYRDNAVENFLQGKNLLMLGKFGTGKTMLMSILCEELVYKYSFNCKYFNSVDLLYKIKSTFDGKSSKTFTDLLQQYKQPEFLFVDDIDKLNPTDFIREFMYGLVNYRIENQKPMIISANSSLEQLDNNYFGEAVVSRLVEHSREIIFNSENMRLCGNV